MEVQFMKLVARAVLPTYAYDGDAGLDLHSVNDVQLFAGTPELVGTGLVVAIPEGYEGQIRPRSSLSVHGVHVSFGTIDSGYRGELCVIVTPLGIDTSIAAGTKIAQLVIKPCPRIEPVEVATLRMPPTSGVRGRRGFGSSGP